MAKRTPTVILFTNGNEDGMGRVVATLTGEHIAFDLTYDPSGFIAVDQYDEDELHHIIRTTI